MTDEPINLNEQRAIRTADNRHMTPRDCLEVALRDLETLGGPDRVPTRAFVLLVYEKPGEVDGPWRVLRHGANLTHTQEIALLSYAHAKSLEDWDA